MGGVIFRQDSEEAFHRFRKAGLNPEIYMGAYGQKDFFLDLETGTTDAEGFCHKMALASGRNHVTWDEAQYCWLGFIHDVPTERLHDLMTLRERFHLCLLSNTNPFIMAFTRSNKFSTDGQPISHYFDTLFCSYEMNVCKPDPDIFIKALATDKMKAEETVFVDDSRKNIETAETLGIHGLHVATNADWMEKLTCLIRSHNDE